MIVEGDLVPDFDAEDANGNKIKSSNLSGKPHVIYFYPKDFTPGCTTEADEFSKEYSKFKNDGIEIIGISPDDIQSHKKFCEKMKISYILLADTNKQIAKSFGVWGKKKFMGREYMGVNRSTFLVNGNNTVFKVFAKVKPKGHAQEVWEEFKKLKENG